MPFPKPTSLRFALLCLVALAMLPAYALLGYSALELRERVGREGLRNAAYLTRTISWEQERVLREARELAQILSTHSAITDPVKSRHCAEFLADIRRTMPRYGNIGLASRDGDIYCSAATLPGRVNVSDRLYFRRAMETRGFAVGDYVIGRVTGRPAVTVAYPIAGIDGGNAGIVFIAIDLAWLNEFLGQADLPEGSSVRVVDRTGTVLAGYPDDSITGSKLKTASMERAAENFKDPAANTRQAYTWLDEGKIAHAVLPISPTTENPAFVWTGISNTGLNAEIEDRFYRYLLWMGAATLIMFALAWIGSGVLVSRAARRP